jgi:elongation factor Ts
MSISASVVKELRERTGAGMMDCKKALVETNGDADAAAELLRTTGQAKAEKKAGRIAAEGRVEIATNAAGRAVMLEINCETDFVAKDQNFLDFAQTAASLALTKGSPNVDELLAALLPGSETLDVARKNLIAKIGENIALRRLAVIAASGSIGHYIHGNRIGVIVDVVGGDEELRRDLAMHIAAAAPSCIADSDVPADQLERERRILIEQAANEGKPPEIVVRMVEGRLRKYLAEVTLLGQTFVKDPDLTIAKLLAKHGATVKAFARFEVGEGIEKKQEDFAAEVAAQVNASR